MTEVSAPPHPVPTPHSTPFWDALDRGVLLVQQCRGCLRWTWVPKPVCPTCVRATLEWREASGLGTLYSYTIVHRPQHPSFHPPYLVVIVELDEGPRMLTQLIGVEDVHSVRIGARVRCAFGSPLRTFGYPFELLGDSA